jgi:hypothetical protein
MKKTFLVLLIFSAIISQPVASQPGRPYLNIEREIEAYLLQKYSKEYIVGVDPFDTLLVHVRDAAKDEEFLDPYGTLKGRMFFSAWQVDENDMAIPEAKEIYGFSINGSVLWDSGPLCTSGGSYVLGSSDLNRDGEVDVLVSVRDADRDIDYLSYLWIFSWNGTRARILNDVNPQTGQSVLLSGGDWYQLFDWQGDGIMEIWAFWDKENVLFPDSLMSTRPYVTYSYNGSLYGLWPNTVQIPSTTFLANNRLSVKASCWVAKNGLSFEYYYRWSNDPASLQKIRSIFLQDVDQEATMISPPVWLTLLPTKPFSAILWDLEDSQKRRMIAVGQVAEGFGLKDTCLPAIVRYFVKGYAPSSAFWDDPEQTHTDEEVRNDLLMNSVIGFTIAPKQSLSPFQSLNFLDTISNFTTQSRTLGWIKDQSTANKYLGYFGSAKTSLQQNNIASTRATLQQVLQDANIDSTANITSEAYALIRYNTEYLLAQLPTTPVAGCNVKLVGSSGSKLAGGSLQYYEGSWKDATNNNDGTFFVNTTAKTLSLRMTYEYGTQTKSNVTVGPDTVVFQTVNTQVKLQNSQGVAIDTGSVQYYAGAWRNFGTTSNGIAAKELLPANYSFRITYAYASKDKQQDIGANATVVFQTVNASVQLQNSQGTLIDQGVVQYYSGAWRDFGSTTNGVANKELLPNNYSFRMSYAYASKDKQQDIGTNPTVVFQTVNAAVQLQNSQGALIDQGTVQYYSGAWREFGSTTNGVANKELLPNNYSFRMTYAYASKDKQQDIGANPTVVFQTVNATVQLKNSLGNLIDQGTVQYYSGAWRAFGTTVNGVANKELLPNNYSFRMTNEYVSLDKSQDLSTNSTVDFSTVLCTISVKNAQNQSVDGAAASYYSGAWRQIGNTVGGQVTKELLPVNLTFRVKYGSQQQDKQQNLSTNNVVEFAVQ